METISDILGTGSEIANSILLFLSAAITWLLGRLTWWKALPNTFVKGAIAVVVFLAVAFTLSAITALFT